MRGLPAANALFAAGYVLCGPGALAGTDGVRPASPYFTAFFFSVETLATIGYGNVAPDGLAANMLVTFESLIGLLGFALSSGMVFARFARPVARIIFSRRAVIAPYRGRTAFMFRIVERAQQPAHRARGEGAADAPGRGGTASASSPLKLEREPRGVLPADAGRSSTRSTRGARSTG